jgi:hypothetical protein
LEKGHTNGLHEPSYHGPVYGGNASKKDMPLAPSSTSSRRHQRLKLSLKAVFQSTYPPSYRHRIQIGIFTQAPFHVEVLMNCYI